MSLANSCQVTQGSCVSLEAVFLWSQPQQHCNFLRVYRVKTRIEGNLWIDSERGYLFNVSHPRILNEQACPPIQIYATDIEDLYVTQDPLTVHLLEVDALNVEEDMDLIPSIKFLAHNTGIRLSQLEGRLAGNGCSLRSKFPNQEIRRWPEGGAGMFACRVGNLLQAFSCVHRIAPKILLYRFTYFESSHSLQLLTSTRHLFTFIFQIPQPKYVILLYRGIYSGYCKNLVLFCNKLLTCICRCLLARCNNFPNTSANVRSTGSHCYC